MVIAFPAEDDEGNIEYKRHLCSDELKSQDDNFNTRFHQLTTQLKFRLSEGNGTAIYFIGINDDGSFHKLCGTQISTSVSNLKKMAIHINAKVSNVNVYKDYVKVIVKDLNIINSYPEKRILLLGDTGTGKTTFLAYLIKNKLDTDNCKSRLFILNHKHELETGKTSSFNYQYLNYNKNKFVFVDTPGDDKNYSKNIKTRNKIILSFKFDLILFMFKSELDWDKRMMFIYYAKFLNIPFLEINLFSLKSKINLVDPLPKDDILEILNNKMKEFHYLVIVKL